MKVIFSRPTKRWLLATADSLAQFSGLALVALGAAVVVHPLGAAPTRIVQPSPGGIDPRPVILSVTNLPGHFQAFCAGFGGGPFQAVSSPSVTGGTWTPLGPVFNTNYFTVNLNSTANSGFLRISGPDPAYGGAAFCALCHSDPDNPGPYDSWVNTGHANAFNYLPAFARTNASCLPCHTVGFGFPNGYTIGGNSGLQGVQCENCHGPGGSSYLTAHNTPSRAFRRPDVELNAMLCGGCHTTDQHPTYEEWSASPHGKVTPDFANGFSQSQLTTCAVCHSGAARLALLKAHENGTDYQSRTNVTLPTGAEAASISPVCVVCHDPHGSTTNAHLVRNPLFSTNFFSYTTSTNFASQYDPSIQMCGQCHNARGAAWTDTSRPPHHSPQYNMLVANIGVTTNTVSLANMPPHWALSNQCVHCHMQTQSYAQPTALSPNDTGHGFAVKYFDACFQCHINPEFTKEAIQFYVQDRINEVKAQLDLWATSKAPASLSTKYGALAWEYNNPGQLSNPTSDPLLKGPTTAEQANVPNNIKQARFNLYLVLHDGSYGVHNSYYAEYLLNVAEGKVQAELAR